jgi:hypothetical protein
LSRLDAASATHDGIVRDRFTDKPSAEQLRLLADAWTAVLTS